MDEISILFETEQQKYSQQKLTRRFLSSLIGSSGKENRMITLSENFDFSSINMQSQNSRKKVSSFSFYYWIFFALSLSLSWITTDMHRYVFRKENSLIT